MEDEGIIKKGAVFFIVALIILLVGILFYFILYKGESEINNPSNPNTPSEDPIEKDEINEYGIYGRFINLEDQNSYLELKENGDFKFIMNICEGYLSYNNENADLNKNIEKKEDNYDISITIIPKSTLDSNRIQFSSQLVSATGVVIEYIGPYTCSPSTNYKREEKTLD